MIPYIPLSPFAEASLHFLIALVLSGEKPLWCRAESNSGLPSSKPKYESLCVFSSLLFTAKILVLVRSGNMGYDKPLMYEDMFRAIRFDSDMF
jgi:hypothetical protein